MLERAENALAAAKDAGRDRVYVADGLGEPRGLFTRLNASCSAALTSPGEATCVRGRVLLLRCARRRAHSLGQHAALQLDVVLEAHAHVPTQLERQREHGRLVSAHRRDAPVGSVVAARDEERSTLSRAPSAPGTPSTNCTQKGRARSPARSSKSALSRWPSS